MLRTSRFLVFPVICACLVGCLVSPSVAERPQDLQQKVQRLPLEPVSSRPTLDWLIDDRAFSAQAYRNGDAKEIILSNGLVRRAWRIVPNGACVALDDVVNQRSLLRAVRPEAILTIDGAELPVGGLTGQPNHAFLTRPWLDRLRSPKPCFQLVDFEVGEPRERLLWRQVRHHAPESHWPPPGIHLRMDYRFSNIGNEQQEATAGQNQLAVSVHYELYDGLPCFSKWISVQPAHGPNAPAQPHVIDRLTCEILALVEDSSWVETREGVQLPRPADLHVETDFAFGGFNHQNANRHVVHWNPDPDYATQVNYLRKSPCLLVVSPSNGPAQEIPAAGFESFRTFELVYDSTERERRGLALRRMYRKLAPWVTENPLMMHLRTSNPQAVRDAIEQCADVGFEMLILSFGSGFDIENADEQYIRQWKELADLAHSRGVEIGGYSLLASRSVGGGNDVVSPAGEKPTFGNAPALTSDWGQEYFAKLQNFYQVTGFDLLEHDGSYPGDIDTTSRPPLQKGELDSRWAQWQVITRWYQWCRAQGIYLNVPDYYYLSGSNKCGMGYRETNWSLPREQQLIHTRQNIFDGTWSKTPTMGWMFVPLTEYHGGGPEATIEPLEQHLDHYRRMLQSNLGLGVQACYRGPRLFDTDATRQLVRSQVSWFKRYRDILESDLVHGRRADGLDLDWMLHVNPNLEIQGMLCVFNPTDRSIEKTLRVDLYYTGITDRVEARIRGETKVLQLDRAYRIELPVRVDPGDMQWIPLRDASGTPDG